MTRILLTGGSGFIAAWVLETLLERGHSVVTTVRSQEKAKKIKDAHPNVPKEKLDFFIVEDIAVEGAFDQAVKSDPPFEGVIHTASPFHYNVTDVKKDLLDPAIIGTTGILKAVHKNAPSVKRIVITSSFASIVDGNKGLWPGHEYTEKDWDPITYEEALQNPHNGYRASKTFAEKAAWEFLEKEKPNFTIATMCPPLVFGPIIHFLNSLSALNTSNQRVRDFIQGKAKEALPPSGVFLWVDVRDLALAHVKAVELPGAANQRFFVTAGYYSNVDVVNVIRKNFPDLASKFPEPGSKGEEPGLQPKELYGYNNSKTKEVLGIEFNSLDKTITDLVKSLQAAGA